MKFKVILNHERVPQCGQNIAYLWADKWDDHKFKTVYHLKYFDSVGERHDIGALKIGEFSMNKKQALIPCSFEYLPKKFFSFGQDADYYYNIMLLNNKQTRKQLLSSLNDIANNEELYSHATNEKVTDVSLFHPLPKRTIERQFRRILSGGARLTEYSFSYLLTPFPQEKDTQVELKFHITPESLPPSNIHVLIGSNGVGKTHILNSMIRALTSLKNKSTENGIFFSNRNNHTCPFVNVVFVSFSAFDDLQDFQNHNFSSNNIQLTYIGLQKKAEHDPKRRIPLTKNPEELAEEFSESAVICSAGTRGDRWKKALGVLEVDTVFADAKITDLADLSEDDFRRESLAIYKRLSAGHKMVLLTITKLIECVHEKTLILMEEPEEHLHPPLLSAFIGALSDLLSDRNGVAIVTTHSPIVVQEVPRSCVWKIYRSGNYIEAHRPKTQTFGENVGILMSEIFGLKIMKSGFHRMLDDESKDANSIDEVLAKFDDGVGTEGRALINGIIARKVRSADK